MRSFGGYTTGGASSSTNADVGGQGDGHVLWGTLSDASGSSSVQSSSSGNDHQKTEYRNRALNGAFLATAESSSSHGSSGSSIPADRDLPVEESRLRSRVVYNAHVATSQLSRSEVMELRQLPRCELNPYIPFDAEGNQTSIGSINHAFDACSPCQYARRMKGCRQGIYCLFCHFVHADMKERKTRPCKTQRVRYRRGLERLEADMRAQGDPHADELATILYAPREIRQPSTKKATMPQDTLPQSEMPPATFGQSTMPQNTSPQSEMQQNTFAQRAMPQNISTQRDMPQKLSL